jgi:hypothetical protein
MSTGKPGSGKIVAQEVHLLAISNRLKNWHEEIPRTHFPLSIFPKNVLTI